MNINNIKTGVFSLLILVSLSGCKENELTELTTLKVDRAFSPTGLTATVANKITVKLTWNAVKNANSYTVELYKNADFSGTPVKTINNIAYTQLPYTISALDGDTQYSVRVKAVGPDVGDSKWITALFKTDPEQIFIKLQQVDIAANSVILRWLAGQVATSITVTPGNITHIVTPAEITAGAATITGLTGETTYTAKLLNGVATRGTATFDTDVDVSGGILINSVAAFNTAVATAADGQLYVFAVGDYDFTGSTVALTKSISIVGPSATQRPTLKNVTFSVRNGAAFKLKNLIIDGGGTLNSTVTYGTAGNFGDLKIEGSIIRNYAAGILGLTSTSAISVISSVLINNNVFNTFGTGGEFIDMRASFPNKLNFTNNTLYAQGAREFMRMDASASATYPVSKVLITVSNNTLYSVATTVKRVFYVRIPAANHEIYFTKNIVASTDGLLANQAATNLVTLSGNNYFGAPSMIASTATGAKVDAGGTALDPGFKTPATGDFTLSNATLISNAVGDPRWR